jgi:hypothetical protein
MGKGEGKKTHVGVTKRPDSRPHLRKRGVLCNIHDILHQLKPLKERE